MATDNHEEIRAWGWLLSELKSIAQREGVEVTLDDEDLYITAPRAGYPLIMRKLLSAAAIKPEDDAVIRAIADNTEPGEDYGTTYQRLTLEDQGALMLESMRFDSNMISVEEAAARLSASEQRVLSLLKDGKIQGLNIHGVQYVFDSSIQKIQ